MTLPAPDPATYLSPQARRLLRAALHPADAPDAWAAYAAHLSDGPIDEGEERLFPLVAANLPDTRDAAARAELLRAAVATAIRRRTAADRARDAAAELLDAVGIPRYWTKGSAIAGLYYDRPHHRTSMDVDAIVRWDDVSRLRDHLVAEGLPFKNDLNLKFGPARVTSSEISFALPGHTDVDVAWAPRMPFAFDPWLAERLWDRRTADAMPGPTWLLVEAIEHGLSVNVVAPIRWITDAAMLLRKAAIDWPFVARIADRYLLSTQLRFGLDVLEGVCPDLSDAIAWGRDALATVTPHPLEGDELYQRIAAEDGGVAWRVYRTSCLLLRSDDETFAGLARWGRPRHFLDSGVARAYVARAAELAPGKSMD